MTTIDTDALIDTACAETGLDDFGDPSWREALDVLVDAFEREADLNDIGAAMGGARAMTATLCGLSWT